MITSKHNNISIVVFLMFLLFPFVQQRTYGDLPHPLQEYIVWFYKYYSLVSASIVFSIVLKYSQLLNELKQYLFWVVLFWLGYIASTLINCPEEILSIIFRAYTYVALILLVIIGYGKWRFEFLTALSIIYGGWIWMTLITSLLFPDGLYKTASYHSAHLLGDDNALAYVMLPGLVILCINSIVKKGKIDTLTWIAIIGVTFLLIRLWAASGMLSVFLFALLIILIKYTSTVRGKWLLLGLVTVIIITLFGLSNQYVMNIIENYIEKDITLTGRTVLWAGALNMISMQPIFGYGGFFKYGTFMLGGNIEYPCHTPYLQLLIDGGIILFVIFVVLTYNTFRKTDKYKHNTIGIVLTSGLFCMMLNYITEYSQFLHLFIIMTMIQCTNPLKGNQQNGIEARNRK